MYLVEILKDYGQWAKKGKTRELSDHMTFHMSKKGVVKIIKYLGKHSESPYYLRRSIESAKRQIKELQDKIKMYEKRLKESEK